MKSKKMIAFFLSLAMIAGSFPVMVSADETDAPEASEPAVIEETVEEAPSDDTETEEDSEEEVDEELEDEADVFDNGDSEVSWSDFKDGVSAKVGQGDKTYVLSGDVTRGGADYALWIDGDVTIDLNGHTIDSTASGYSLFGVTNGHVTIKNGTIIGRNKSDISGVYAYDSSYDGNDLVTLEGLTVKNFYYAINTDINVVVKDCSIVDNGCAFLCDGSYDYNSDMIKLQGQVIIKGNGNGTDINLAEGDVFTDIDDLTSGSKIGISMNTPGAFTPVLTEAQQGKIGYFFSNNTDYYVALDNSRFVLASTSFEANTWAGIKSVINTVPSTGYIRLTGDCVASDNDGSISIPSGKDITIDLYGYKIDKNHNKLGSVINNSGTLTIIDSSESKAGQITGGHARQGAGIYNTGRLNLSGGSVTGNYAAESAATDQGKNGAGIYNLRGTVYINGGNVTDNNTSANVKFDRRFEGGGIYNSGGTIHFYSGTVSGNKAQNGAGIYSSSGTVNIYSGGIVSNNTCVVVSGNSYGGGIYNLGDLTITKATFSQNTAMDGGAIYSQGVLNVTGATFTENTATSGGAVYNGAYPNAGNAEIKNASFTQNSAVSGGAIYNETNSGKVAQMKLEDLFILYNTASNNGGAIYNTGSLIITSDTPADQTSTSTINGCGGNTAGGNGGAVYNTGSLSITNWVARLNTAKMGGAIFNNGTLTLTGVIVDGNEATNAGGGFYLDQNVTISGNITVKNNKVNDADNNVYIVSDEKIVIGDALGTDSSIGVTYGTDTGSGSYTFTEGYDKDSVVNFVSDSTLAVISLDNSGELAIHICQPNIITGYDMTLAEALCFRLTIQLGDSIDRDSAYVMLQGPNESEPVRFDLTPDSTGICVIPYTLYARQLGADIKYALFDENGLQQMNLNGTALVAFKISAQQYLEALKTGDYSANAKKLADAMLMYGGFSKSYLENKSESDRVSAMSSFAHANSFYNEGRALNDYTTVNTDSFSDYKPGIFQGYGSDVVGIRGERAGLGYNIGYDSISLVAKDKVALRLYFKGDITNADFEIFTSKKTSLNYSDGQRGDITDYTVGQEHGMYYIEIPDIAAYDLGTKIYVEFLTHLSGWEGSGYTYNYQYRRLAYGIEVSPLSYAYTVMYYYGSDFKTHSDVYLSKALLVYYLDAKAYKEAPDQ